MVKNDDSKELQELVKKADEVKKRITKLRRLGVDTKIAEIESMDLNPKLSYARATKELKDLEPIVSLLEKIKIEANRRDVPYQSLIKVWLGQQAELAHPVIPARRPRSKRGSSRKTVSKTL